MGYGFHPLHPGGTKRYRAADLPQGACGHLLGVLGATPEAQSGCGPARKHPGCSDLGRALRNLAKTLGPGPCKIQDTELLETVSESPNPLVLSWGTGFYHPTYKDSTYPPSAGRLGVEEAPVKNKLINQIQQIETVSFPLPVSHTRRYGETWNLTTANAGCELECVKTGVRTLPPAASSFIFSGK